MLQLQVIRQNPDWVKERLKVKQFKDTGLVDTILSLDDQRKKLQLEFDTTQSKVNSTSKEIGQLMGKGQKEEAEAKKLGMKYFNIPVSNQAGPKDEQADEFLKLTDDAKNRPVFIHCGSANRVGGFFLIRRVLRDGMTFDAAKAEATKIGLRAPTLEEFAKQYIDKHKK